EEVVDRDPAVHVPADDRAVTVRVVVLVHRGMVVVQRRRPAVVRVQSLPPAPLVVLSGCSGDVGVDLLPAVLSDVADPLVARLFVERPSPRVAQTDRPDGVVAAFADERVVGRNAELPPSGRLRIDPQHLPEEGQLVLRAVLGIAAGTAVADPYVQMPVRA